LGFVFLADLSRLNISTNGTVGGANTTGTVNLTNFQYSRSNPDPVMISQRSGGIITSSFQFTSPLTLAERTADDYRG
jgi:hypothetical protein